MAVRSQSRSAARLAAVQALFQMDAEDTARAKVLKEFHDHRLGAVVDDEQYAEAEVDFFDAVVIGVDARRKEITRIIADRLSDSWSLERIDPTMLQILRCGIWELTERRDIKTGVIIDEYLDIADAFFDEREKRFAHGLLDAVAKDVRGEK